MSIAARRMQRATVSTSGGGGGFPDASSTGLTIDESELVPWVGPADVFYSNYSDSVVENRLITLNSDEYVYISSSCNNLTFRNCKFVYVGATGVNWTMINNQGINIIFEYCELDGGTNVPRAISTDNATIVRYCNIYHTAQPTEGPGEIAYNYFHDCQEYDPEWHGDAAQVQRGGSNLWVHHNTIIIELNMTSCVFIEGGTDAPNTNILIEENLMAGGGYTIYSGYAANDGDVIIRNNQFSTQKSVNVGGWAIYYDDTATAGLVQRYGNTIYETGAPADYNI